MEKRKSEGDGFFNFLRKREVERSMIGEFNIAEGMT